MFCNYNLDYFDEKGVLIKGPPRKNIQILITNDYVYWIISAVYPLVSGYLISLLMMYSPK